MILYINRDVKVCQYRLVCKLFTVIVAYILDSSDVIYS